jgi:hypothetical protein
MMLSDCSMPRPMLARGLIADRFPFRHGLLLTALDRVFYPVARLCLGFLHIRALLHS